MKNGIIALMCGLMLTCLHMHPVYADDFKWVGQQKQISLFERWIPSAKGEMVRELKAVFVVQSDISAIVDLLKEQDSGIKWNVNAADFQVLQTDFPGQWISYTRYDLPWPLDDQDCCLKYQLDGNRRRMVIHFSSTLNQKFAVSAGVDRITGVKGKWILQKEADNRTKVVYRITTDRSKKVPRWISDRIVHGNLYNTMAAFKTMAEQAS